MAILRNEMLVASRNQGLDQRVEYSGGSPVYMGFAQPGTADSASTWCIYKMSWTDGNMTHLRYADGTDEFTKCWNDRASYDFKDI